jgi:hypothetical protein
VLCAAHGAILIIIIIIMVILLVSSSAKVLCAAHGAILIIIIIMVILLVSSSAKVLCVVHGLAHSRLKLEDGDGAVRAGRLAVDIAKQVGNSRMVNDSNEWHQPMSMSMI